MSTALIDEFVNFENDVVKKFGAKSVVLMQVGKFYECYEWRNEPECIERFNALADIMNLSKMRVSKDNLNREICKKNTLAIGFPTYVIEKYINILCKANFTVCVVNQDNAFSKTITRSIDRICSPATYFNENDTKPDNKFLVSVFLDYIETNKSKDHQLIDLSICYTDLSIGKTYCLEFDFCTSEPDDVKYDTLIKEIEKLNPKELLINTENCPFDHITLFKQMHLRSDICKTIHCFINKVGKHVFRSSWREEFLSKIFETSFVATSSLLGLQRNTNLAICFILMIQFANDHDVHIVERLQIPKIVSTSDFLNLSSNCLSQINIFNGSPSLFNIIDNCLTPMGHRFLKTRLSRPMINIEEINISYQLIEFFSKKVGNCDQPVYVKFRTLLKGIRDLNRYYRKISIGLLEPFEWHDVESSFEAIEQIIHVYTELGLKSEDLDIDPQSFETSLKTFRTFYQKIIDTPKTRRISLKTDTLQDTIFIDAFDPLIDKIVVQLEQEKRLIEEFKATLPKDCTIIDSVGEGHYISVKIGKYKELMKIPENEIFFKNLKSRKLTSSYKFYHSSLETISTKINKLQDQLTKQTKIAFSKFQNQIYDGFNELMVRIADWITTIDVSCCGASLHKEKAFCKPNVEIVENENSQSYSYVKAVAMRHPIIETCSETTYIANDVELGLQLKGILLYGQNFSGKSSFIRMVVTNIILAQAGFFVPCESFTFAPFKKVITKIALQDNIFTNDSTFTMEIKELKNMLSHSDKNTLIVADELCSSSEYLSAVSLVASTILKLVENKTNFIFTTHFHELIDIPEISQLESVKPYQMRVDFENGQIMFCRKLVAGKCENLYGLELARHLQIDNDVLRKSFVFRKFLLGTESQMLSTKSSRYNVDVYLDHCYVCSTTNDLHCHHIVFQQKFKQSDASFSFHKNDKKNLCVLCANCHQKLHQNEIEIEGWMMTSNGPQLKHKMK